MLILIFVVALAGLALVVFLLLTGVDESDTWLARTRRQLRRDRLRLRRSDRKPSRLSVGRERAERRRIEERLEEERNRSALQGPE